MRRNASRLAICVLIGENRAQIEFDLAAVDVPDIGSTLRGVWRIQPRLSAVGQA